jgi:branched-chain amino acid transport system ATP-binding protein
MLRIENLSAYYDSIAALKGVSVEVPKGEVVSIIGANGAGKSTLLKAISGLIKARDGRILYKDRDIAGLPANKIVSFGISQVPEGRQIFAHLTVQDNINLGAYLYYKRQNRQEIQKRIETVFQLFPILKRRTKQVAGTLSGGDYDFAGGAKCESCFERGRSCLCARNR